MKFFVIALMGMTHSLVSLEQPDGSGLMIGAWYDRLGGDTPSNVNQRVNYKPLAFFQSDMNITDTLQTDYIDEFVTQVEATDSDAFIYLTLYPFEGFERVTDSAIDEFVKKVKQIVDTGRKVLIRYASEMNGSWFAYGQQPTIFKREWIKMVTRVREGAGSESVAFLWAPNSGNGYPFPFGPHSTNITLPNFDQSLDTNGDGKYDDLDDPYSPFFPGDEWVDWVGFSVTNTTNSRFTIMERIGM